MWANIWCFTATSWVVYVLIKQCSVFHTIYMYMYKCIYSMYIEKLYSMYIHIYKCLNCSECFSLWRICLLKVWVSLSVYEWINVSLEVRHIKGKKKKEEKLGMCETYCLKEEWEIVSAGMGIQRGIWNPIRLELTHFAATLYIALAHTFNHTFTPPLSHIHTHMHAHKPKLSLYVKTQSQLCAMCEFRKKKT